MYCVLCILKRGDGLLNTAQVQGLDFLSTSLPPFILMNTTKLEFSGEQGEGVRGEAEEED
jgi:hypothetical protein